MRLLPDAVMPTPVHPDTWESWSHSGTAATLRTLWRICYNSCHLSTADYLLQGSARRAGMQQTIVISDDKLAKINAGPSEGRKAARLLLMKQARSNDPHSCVVPMGTEFFNNGELRELLALTAQGRKDLLHYSVTEYTPTELMNL
eukprot:2171624-Heterocapsa_arctica.AAC.1